MADFADYYKDAAQAFKGTGAAQWTSWGRDWTDDTYSAVWSLAQQAMQNDWNTQQAELAFERQKQMIDQQNEYNSPINQMARYQAAGLNPLAIYGQISSGQQSSAAQYAPQQSVGADVKFTRTQQKHENEMNLIYGMANMLKTFTDVAARVEGVKNQDLQNQILQSQVPFEMSKASWMQDLLVGHQMDSEGNLTPISETPNGRRITNLLFPQAAGSENKQRYNDQILPHLASLYEKRASGQDISNELQQYMLDVRDTLPPSLRGLYDIFMPLFRIGLK